MKNMLFLFLMILFTTPLLAREKPVVIVYSDNNKNYIAPARAFKDKLARQIKAYYLGENLSQATATMTNIMKQDPALIFALGARAAWFSKMATKNHQRTKVIFAMVINWQRYDLLGGQNNIMGISSDIAPGIQLFNLGLVSPQVKRVGVIYSQSHSAETITQAKKAADLLGLTLSTEPIERADSFKRAWRKISSEIDAYWVLTDPVLYTLENIYWLNERCLKEKIICIGQSENITKLGILLSINPDEENIGIQAAAMAKHVLNGRTETMKKIVTPIATHVTFNRATAEKIGIHVDEQILSLVNDVVNE
ncbi:MAG TPA: hypothetical protein ENK06_14305 [Gammaproteobacteria bacterium]|nr:hypothetical protein [Gammaproteobacteria bacterium]